MILIWFTYTDGTSGDYWPFLRAFWGLVLLGLLNTVGFLKCLFLKESYDDAYFFGVVI